MLKSFLRQFDWNRSRAVWTQNTRKRKLNRPILPATEM